MICSPQSLSLGEDLLMAFREIQLWRWSTLIMVISIGMFFTHVSFMLQKLLSELRMLRALHYKWYRERTKIDLSGIIDLTKELRGLAEMHMRASQAYRDAG